jgi:hypothetical protein
MEVVGMGVVVPLPVGMVVALCMDMPERMAMPMGVVMGMVVKGVERVVMWHWTTSAR